MGTPIQEPGFDPGLHDIRHVIDLGLMARNEILGDSGAEAWRASSLGYCLRRQLFDRAGVPATRKEGLSRTLWLGDIIHRAVQRMVTDSGLMLAEEITLLDDDTHLSGHVDLIWGGTVQDFDYGAAADRYGVFGADFISNYRKSLNLLYGEGDVFPVTMTEFKSANQWSAEGAYRDGVQFHHGIQAGAYRFMAESHPEVFPDAVAEHGGITRFQVVMLAKSDLKMPVFEIFPGWAGRAEERLHFLNEFWAEKMVPPCTCGQDIGWEKRYCKYRHPADEGKKDPRCCMPDLIEGADPAFWADVLTQEVEDEAQRSADEQEVLPTID